jgi:Arc/MetJ-type ribon-helix-helix transcriptional regulator
MVKSAAAAAKKKRGRPATGRDPVTAIRLSTGMRKQVDAWAAGQTDKPSRSEAIRRLVGLGLEYLPRAKQRTKKKAAAKASEMAGSMIDWLSDRSAPPAERAKRKRRLVKGPEEFREIRSDLPKPKG